MGEALMEFALKMLNLHGFDPRKQNMYSKFKSCLAIINLVTIFGLNLWEIVFNWNGVKTLEETYYLPMLFLYTTKSIVLVANQKVFLKLIMKTTEFWRIDDFEEEIKTDLNNFNMKVLRCGQIFVGSCIFMTTYLVFDSIAIGATKPIFPGYQFCNISHSPCYEITWVWHFILLFWYIIPICPGLDTFFCASLSYAYITFKLIKYKLNEITKIINSEKCNKNILRIKIGEVVEQHNIVLECIALINRFFMQIILVVFLFTFGTLTACLYMVAQESLEFSKRFSFGIFYVLLVTILFMYAVGGIIIMEQSKSIAFEAYDIEWYKTDPELWKNLCMVIHRANNVPCIKIGNVVDLTLEPFVSVLKNSFSCYMLIKTLEHGQK